METYPLKDEHSDYPFAFEIENVYAGPAAIGRLLSQVNDVSDVRVRRMFGKWEDIHVWFKYANRDCVVWEPYGDCVSDERCAPAPRRYRRRECLDRTSG